MAFFGKIPQILDDKKRIAIPAKWRDQFDAPAFLTAGPEGCIAIYTKADFEAASAEVLAVSASTKAGRDGRRTFFGNTADVAKDTAGRLLVPQQLIDHAKLTRDIVVVGAGEWFEVWDKAIWDEYDAARAGE
jgi:MraZ protein